MLAAFAQRLAATGLDVALPVPVASIGSAFAWPFPTALLIGNSRALWEHLPHPLSRRERPIDNYVERVVAAACADLPVRHHVYFGHQGPPFVPLVAAARAAGLKLGACQLAIHPTFGPWLALRALVCMDIAPAFAPLAPAACDCNTGCGAPGLTTSLDRRLACPLGRPWQYSDAQIRYHYGIDDGATC